MPMFDNPNKELQRLQAQLLSEEEEELDELMDAYNQEDYQELFEEDYEEECSQEPYFRGYVKAEREKRI